MAIDPSSNAPATLGIGGVGIEAGGVLDLNGCSLTLTSLNAGDASLNGGAINNTLTGPGPRSVGTAVLTLDYNNLSMPCDFAGTIAGKADATDPPIRFVKTGQGELDCDGPACMSIPGGFEIDAGKVVMNLVGPPDGNGGSDGYVPLDMNGGTLDVHGSELFLDQLNGSGGTIEDSDGVGDITLDPGEDINLGGPSVFGGAIDQSLTGGGNGGIGLLLNGPGQFYLHGKHQLQRRGRRPLADRRRSKQPDRRVDQRDRGCENGERLDFRRCGRSDRDLHRGHRKPAKLNVFWFDSEDWQRQPQAQPVRGELVHRRNDR